MQNGSYKKAITSLSTPFLHRNNSKPMLNYYMYCCIIKFLAESSVLKVDVCAAGCSLFLLQPHFPRAVLLKYA